MKTSERQQKKSVKRLVHLIMEKKTWEEFSKTGLVLIINQTLHIFGWCIVQEVSESGKILNVFPARVKFRGFDNKDVTEAYGKITKYMKENAKELSEEIKD